MSKKRKHDHPVIVESLSEIYLFERKANENTSNDKATRGFFKSAGLKFNGYHLRVIFAVLAERLLNTSNLRQPCSYMKPSGAARNPSKYVPVIFLS